MRRETTRSNHALSRKPSAVILMLAALLTCLTVTEVTHAAGLESYRLATGYYQRRKWSLSAQEFRVFLKELPEHPKAEKAQVFLGMALINLKEFKDARDVFRTFILKYQESRYLSHAMYRAGECSFLLNDSQAAETELTSFLEKFPDDPLAPRARFNLAESKLSVDKPAAAVELYQTILKDETDTVLLGQAKLGLAKSYGQLKKYPEAEQLYTELTQELKGEAAVDAGMRLADLYFDRLDYPAAAKAYGQVVSNFPQSPLNADARLKWGMSLFGARKFLEAAEQLQQLSSDERHATEAGFWQGVSLKSAGENGRAIEVLKANYASLGDSPKAPRTLYQWADSEQRAGQYEAAIEHFSELVRRWPEHALADDALHAAALSSLKTEKLAEAETLLARFSNEYPTSGLRYRQQLVQGRLYLAMARTVEAEQAAQYFSRAEKEFREVMENSTIEATQHRARYFLAFSAHELGKHEEALRVIEPLTRALNAGEESADETYLDAYVLQALCQFKLEQFEAAGTSASAYLTTAPEGEFAAQALGIKARAVAKLGDKTTAAADHAKLKAQWPQSEDFARTTEELADIAFANEDFVWAAQLFEQLSQFKKDSKYRPIGLSGLGWSHYQQQQYEQAATAFETLVKEYPQHRLAAEAGFKQGASLRELGKDEAAAQVFSQVFEMYAPSDKAFVSGLAAARRFRALKRIDDADGMYDALLKKYPQREDLDQLLNEWAVMHYVAENFQRADAIYRRIVQEYPDSKRANDARLNLAISDLLAGKYAEARTQLKPLVADKEADAELREEAMYRLIAIEVQEQQWKTSRELSEQLLAEFSEGKHLWDARYHVALADYWLQEFEKARPELIELKDSRKESAVEGEQASDGQTVGEFEWFPKVWVMLAEIGYREKKYDDVKETVAAFRESDPDSPALYFADEVLGRSLKAQARYPEAREAFERVIHSKSGAKTETAAKSQFLIAETYFFEQQYEQAIREYLKVDILYDFPEYQSVSLFGAGMCEEKLDRWSKAVETYQDLLKRFPESEVVADVRKRLANAQQKVSR